MEPLSPNDPLWKLLGQAKTVKPRANFVQNVVRAARQTPQERGMLARMRAWFAETSVSTGRMAWAGVAVAAVALVAAWPLLPEQQAELAVVKPEQTVPSAPAVAEGEFPTVSTPDTQWVKMQQFDALLAVQDTSQLTDREINFLLY